MLAKAQSLSLFGVISPLGASSSMSLTAAQANADPVALVTLAPGLTAKVISADPTLGASTDMMALWLNDTQPTHIIACNEQGNSNVGLQRIDIATGAVADIVSSGLTSCDPAHRTPWGAIVFGEWLPYLHPEGMVCRLASLHGKLQAKAALCIRVC